MTCSKNGRYLKYQDVSASVSSPIRQARLAVLLNARICPIKFVSQLVMVTFMIIYKILYINIVNCIFLTLVYALYAKNFHIICKFGFTL